MNNNEIVIEHPDAKPIAERIMMQYEAAVESSKPVRPEFIRLPTGGLCPWTGLSRSKMCQLILPCEWNDNSPPVRSICLRKQGAEKGARLIPFQELLDYLYSKLE